MHGLGALNAVARHIHGHAPGHQVPEYLGVAIECGPMGRCVAPFVPKDQSLSAAPVRRALELVVIAALDGLQQRLVPLILGAVYVQRVGRAPVVHAVVVVVVIDVVVDVAVAVAVVVVTVTESVATAYHN